jgi:glycosyltransferase involved in cell wall biosynthesis
MKVVLLCNNDWANVAYVYEKCLREVDIDAISFSSKKHHYGYPEQAILWKNINDIKSYVEECDVLIFVHSEYIETGVDLNNKIISVIHTGSRYRQNSKKINDIFNPLVDITFSGGDVLGMGAKNEVWIQPAIDIKKIQPFYYKSKDKTIIAHYPSGSKGYPIINDVIGKLNRKNFMFKYDPINVSWEDNLKRMSECDIYIEEMNSDQNGIPLYIFGIQAIEAASLGKIVCSRFPMFDKYEETFGECGLIPTNTPEILKEKLEEFLSMDDSDFIELQKKSRRWVENCHSYKVIGKRFKTIFNKLLKEKDNNV